MNRKRASDAIVVDVSGLRQLDVRPKFGDYLKSLWNRRDFIAADARGRAFRTTRDYRLWKFWLIAGPMLDALMYGALFGLLLRTSRGIDNYVGFVVLGIVYFSFLSKMLQAGSGLVAANRSMIRTLVFPRASLVLAQSLRYLYDTVPAAIVAMMAALVFQYQEPLSWTVVLVVPLFLLMLIFGTGLMFITARLTAFIPDVKAIIDIGSRAWLFGSGVFFSVERFATNPIVYDIMTFNPAYRFLTAVRNVVMYSTVPDLGEWMILAAWSFGTLIIGLIFFWQAEERYVKVA